MSSPRNDVVDPNPSLIAVRQGRDGHGQAVLLGSDHRAPHHLERPSTIELFEHDIDEGWHIRRREAVARAVSSVPQELLYVGSGGGGNVWSTVQHL